MTPFWLLKAQPWREHEWLLDVFSRSHGRLQLTASARMQPDLLVQFQGDWQQGSDWPRLPLQQTMWQASQWSDDGLACGLYLTELLVQLLPDRDPQPVMFDLYSEALKAIANSSHAVPWLRLFEQTLLQSLGYGFSWHLDHQRCPIDPNRHYQFYPQLGWQLSESGVAGQWLLDYAHGSHRPELWQMARQTLQLALKPYLQRPLVSHCLRRQSATYSAGDLHEEPTPRPAGR